MQRFLGVLLLATCVFAEYKGVATIHGKNNINGRLVFIQHDNIVHIEGKIEGLSPGKHGFHVHQLGDLDNDCLATKGHFNPTNKSHGAPTAEERHVGDLGNIIADNTGVAFVNITDHLISLCPTSENNVMGRAILIHKDEDDLGLTDHKDSKTTGNAGARLACAVIGILEEGPCSGSQMNIFNYMGLALTFAMTICNVMQLF